jgi:plastocyanin domain-containing protein
MENWRESVFPGLKITNELKAPKTVIAFTPKKAGKFAFTCSIGRYEGIITVK